MIHLEYGNGQSSSGACRLRQGWKLGVGTQCQITLLDARLQFLAHTAWKHRETTFWRSSAAQRLLRVQYTGTKVCIRFTTHTHHRPKCAGPMDEQNMRANVLHSIYLQIASVSRWCAYPNLRTPGQLKSASVAEHLLPGGAPHQ